MPARLTVLVHTRDEETQIEECLRSVAGIADEVLLVDSFSTDRTLEITRTHFPQVRIEQREYLGAASQKNWGIDQASHDWILVVDADERIPPSLAAEIRAVLDGNPAQWAYSIRRRNFMLGDEVRFGGSQRDRVTRLFHRGHARYQNRRVHAEMDVDGRIGLLREPMIHLNIRSLDHLMSKLTRYGVQGATQLYLDGKRARWIDLVFRPLIRMSRDYLFYLGILDGKAGAVYVGMHASYVCWKWAKLWEFGRLEAKGLEVPLAALDRDKQRWARPWETKA